MSLVYEPLLLSAASLSNGARLAAVSGVLPQRITTKDDIRITGLYGWSGGVFSADGTHFIYAKYGNGDNKLYRHRVSDGAFVNSIQLGLYPSGFVRAHGRNELFCMNQGSGGAGQAINEIDSNAGALVRSVAIPAGRFQIAQVPGVTDKIWQIPYPNGTLTEYTWPGMVATGRAIGTVSVVMTSPGYIWCTSTPTGNIIQYDATSLAVVRTYARVLGAAGKLGTSTMCLRGMDIHPITGELYAEDVYLQTQPGLGNIDVWNSSGVAYKRVMWPGEGLNGATRGLCYETPMFQFSDDGDLFIMVVPNVGMTTQSGDLLLRSTRVDQRARWTRAFPSESYLYALTLKSIDVAGCLGSSYWNPQWTGQDFRKALFYYSLDGGVNRTLFTPSATLNLSIERGQTLTVDADLGMWGRLPGPEPYIEGIKLIYDDPGVSVYTPYASARLKARALGGGLAKVRTL